MAGRVNPNLRLVRPQNIPVIDKTKEESQSKKDAPEKKVILKSGRDRGGGVAEMAKQTHGGRGCWEYKKVLEIL